MAKIFPVPSLHLSLRKIDLSLMSCRSRLLFWKFPFFSHVLQYTIIRIDDHIGKAHSPFTLLVPSIHLDWSLHFVSDRGRHCFGIKINALTFEHAAYNMVVSRQLRSLRNSLQHFWKNRHHCGIKLRNATSTDPGNCEQCKWRNKIHRTYLKGLHALSESWLSIEH